MKTFTSLKQAAADYCGLNYDDRAMTKIADDINQGLKLFAGDGDRYWTEQTRRTDLVSNQASYQFPTDMNRVISVRTGADGHNLTLQEITDRDDWARLVSSGALGNPIYYRVLSRNSIALHPTPNVDKPGALIVDFEPRMLDLTLEDRELKGSFTKGRNTIVLAESLDTPAKYLHDCYISLRSGYDDNWYPVVAFMDDKTLVIENEYLGEQVSSANFVLGQCPPIPEEYHTALVYYACQQFFLLRKDLSVAQYYQRLFENAIDQYRSSYSSRTNKPYREANRGVVYGAKIAFPWRIG